MEILILGGIKFFFISTGTNWKSQNIRVSKSGFLSLWIQIILIIVLFSVTNVLTRPNRHGINTKQEIVK